MITLSELQIKEVIVINDGRRLGHISDLEIDGRTGKITALVLDMKEKKSGLFGKADELVIPWGHIEVIGSDVILVREVTIPALYPDQQLLE
ncbi:sporulation protein, YlmC/YmxH family [Lentibacillus persicus]|uniref:Sporulation protein, YlmC/YmxH family n=1 Tax=Lentibacillus persicus TaxID=640948 RepID=A0A1I1VH80_9BACI|nr:YlmC/YmxH family sporulation protein [Lentibacillus persicus]SFD82351.1 sporulation protein, YlmC/YmxH family [Lentibacillus persicus]